MKAIISILFVVTVLLGAFSLAQVSDTDIHTDLSGQNEVPPTNSTATGEARASLDGNELTIRGSFDGLSSELIAAPSAHVHEGAAGAAGPIVFNLVVDPDDDNRGGDFSLTATLTDDQKQALLDGGYYVNVHTIEFPNGEIRGQFAGVNITEEVNDENETNQTQANRIQNETRANQIQQNVTQANITHSQAQNVSVDLHIMKWYPKGPDFVFVCNATGFTPTSYSWFYGDGHKLLNIVNRNTYHVYESLGDFTVSCTAHGDNVSASDTLRINVTSLVRPLHPLFGASNQTQSSQTTPNQTCPTVTVIQNGTATHNGTLSDSGAALKMDMRRLWEDHILWTRLFIISDVNNMTDKDEALARLLRNQDDIGNAIRPFYGDNASQQLASLLKEHIRIAGQIVEAAKNNGSNLSALQAEWSRNADDIAAFLSNANPNLDRNSLRNMLQQHLDLTTQEAVSVINADADGSISAYDSIKQQILSMSDEISNAIIAQFPDRF